MKKLFTFLIALCIVAQTASAGLKGDVNGDNSVNVSDVTALVNRILGTASYSTDVCDLNADGAVNVTDVTALVNIILVGSELKNQTFTVNGVSFEMIAVEGGTFTMGATAEQGSDASSDEYPAHQVTLSSFMIGKTEVTQELWEAVMGSNPSSFSGTNLPVEGVTWSDCQTFITKLNALTGKSFRLPTEAEWEYAARGGNKSQGYKYSGSNTVNDVAWYHSNSSSKTHPVATKAPNELGIYDMSGNVWEWCYDWYGTYSSSSQTNPTGSASGSKRVRRGGSWSPSAVYCRVSCRYYSPAADCSHYLGLRLALGEPIKEPEPNPGPSHSQTFTVNGVSFEMIAVEGGTFTMGATAEQGSDASSDEYPAHQVTVSSFMIGKTEVTQELWEAVMGSNPSSFSGTNLPVERVTWSDCQTFISKLNALTGKSFRLPTEAEWEYAARGGNKSQGYKYSGSNTVNDVAWYHSNSSSRTHPVATKAPNELGLYDMSGNVWEWCYDWYGTYSSSSQTNPAGSASGLNRVRRGGSWSPSAEYCRVSCRYYSHTADGSYYLGLRLAIGEPIKEPEPNPGPLTNQTFTVNGVRFKMIAVEGGTFTMGATSEQGSDAYSNEKPTHQVTLSSYYIGQTEVTQELWKAVMGSYHSANFLGYINRPVELVMWHECQEFITKLNELTGKKFRLPTEAEWEYAARGGNKSKGYKYSGSNTIDDVAWYAHYSHSNPFAVGTKGRNELDIYDMSGNVCEWCNDWYGDYSREPQINPTGPTGPKNGMEYGRVIRGGAWDDRAGICRVSARSYLATAVSQQGIGLRLCLSE